MQRISFDVTDSTNLQAKRLAAEFPGEVLLITAVEQTNGRGRHGRRWQSPVGGAWLSLVWPLRAGLPVDPAASLAAAVGVLRGLRDVAPAAAADFSVKWPNDVLVAQRKVAGILCECLSQNGGGVMIVGVGVNVDFDPSLLTGDLRHPATTLAQASGKQVSVDEVVLAVARRLTEALRAFEANGLSGDLLSELRRSLAYVGSVRRWNLPDGEVTANVLGIDESGRLLLDSATGRITCSIGELVSEGCAV